mmetsp:Transcript_70055/g.154998  ORF Transcript_70055/g.154998 Transcript_70055/m.154998 type:complete len:342 (-) Transcript_70055:733-1758(-)
MGQGGTGDDGGGGKPLSAQRDAASSSAWGSDLQLPACTVWLQLNGALCGSGNSCCFGCGGCCAHASSAQRARRSRSASFCLRRASKRRLFSAFSLSATSASFLWCSCSRCLRLSASLANRSASFCCASSSRRTRAASCCRNSAARSSRLRICASASCCARCSRSLAWRSRCCRRASTCCAVRSASKWLLSCLTTFGASCVCWGSTGFASGCCTVPSASTSSLSHFASSEASSICWGSPCFAFACKSFSQKRLIASNVASFEQFAISLELGSADVASLENKEQGNKGSTADNPSAANAAACCSGDNVGSCCRFRCRAPFLSFSDPALFNFSMFRSGVATIPT